MKKKFGDRRDAYLVRDIDGVHSLMPFIKPKRCDSDVYINQKIDVTELVKYMKKKKKEDSEYTYFHLFLAAMAMTVYNRPLLNRFVINKKYYDRKDIVLSFVAKTEFTDEAEELMTVLTVDKNDTLDDIKNKTVKKVKGVRGSSKNDADKLISLVGKMPKFIKSIFIGIIKFMDNHDLLPNSITDNLIYYSSILVSNLGSIDGGAIYHNLTDLGTNSILITIGKIKKEQVVNKEGKVEVRDICEFGCTLDERIADGLYFIKSVKLLEYILNNPKLLEGKLSEKVEIKEV